jgi:hypothetical protein
MDKISRIWWYRMGHASAKNIYQKLTKKIDRLTFRTPWNDTFYDILRNLFSPAEAELILRMPYSLVDINELKVCTNQEEGALIRMLEILCNKGIIVDLNIKGIYYYTVSPLLVGLFEFTMMRTDPGCDSRELGKLFHKYLLGEPDIMKKNFGNGQSIGLMRTLPYEESIPSDEFVEVMDFEKVSAIVENSESFSVGLCSCRHAKSHTGTRECDVPLESCISIGSMAESSVLHKLARPISKSETKEIIRRGKETGLVFNADNVKNNVK